MNICIFSSWGIMDSTAMNICVPVSVWTYVFSYIDYIPMRGVAGSCGNCLTLHGTADCHPKWMPRFTFLLAVCPGFGFSTCSALFYLFFLTAILVDIKQYLTVILIFFLTFVV